jgi:hypothetical protein
MVRNGEELLASRPTFTLEDHPLPAVLDCLFDIFAATVHIRGRGQIKKNEMGGACSTYGETGEVHTRFWWGNLRERDNLEI